MKLAVITDLHANREAVEAVLNHAHEQGAERYAFLGDYVGYGADPGWVVDTVRRYIAEGAIAVVWQSRRGGGRHTLAKHASRGTHRAGVDSRPTGCRATRLAARLAAFTDRR
ncbi:MAG: metallophosphoesterase family protein [Ideonella sp.]|nr:metallophosphoesterase family protein [Ideonella sp.]